MEYLKNVMLHLAEIVKRMSVSQVVMLVAVIAGSVIGLVAVAGWVGQVTYQPLYSNLDPAEAGDVIRYLSDNKIPYQLTAGGTSIEVPESDLYEARLSLASQGLPSSGTVGYSIFDETRLGMTDFLQKLNFRRALEGELSRTITGLREVAAARVHIVIPEQKLFSEQQKDATASIVLKLKGRGGLSRGQITGITNLVAASVEGLMPNHITIVDYNGNMLSSGQGGDELGSMTSNQLELTQRTERELEKKAQTMMDGVLGTGKAIVRITAELNFEQYSRTSENYDPNMVAIRSEQKTEHTELDSKKGDENLEDTKDNRSEVIVTNYEVSKTVEAVSRAVGTIKRLSIAVLLDGTYSTIENSDGVEEQVYEPRPQEEIDRLAAIIKNAVGYSSDRNDQIEIVNIAFDKSHLTSQQKMLDEQYTREFYYEIGKKVAMFLAAILLLLFVRKKVKNLFASIKEVLPPAPVNKRDARAGATEQPAEEEFDLPEIRMEQRRPKLSDQLQSVAKDDPDEIARVIKTMMVD